VGVCVCCSFLSFYFWLLISRPILIFLHLASDFKAKHAFVLNQC
jgi:hypothetical protein